MTHYHLCGHIYLAQFRNELIVLDLKRNKYTICSQDFSESLLNLLNAQPSNLKDLYSISSHIKSKNLDIEKLIQSNILEQKSVPYPFYIEKNLDSEGVSNIDWRLPLENKKISLNDNVIAAFITLLKVHFYIKVIDFYSAIQLIKKSKKSELDYVIPADAALNDLANIVNKACLIYPTRVKCLEWSMTFVLLALNRGWKCSLEIGVQNYPFMAHAWVECAGKVVMDSQDLREGLAIILNEPFRKLKV